MSGRDIESIGQHRFKQGPAARGDTMAQTADKSARSQQASAHWQAYRQDSRRRILAALNMTCGNLSAASRLLGMHSSASLRKAVRALAIVDELNAIRAGERVPLPESAKRSLPVVVAADGDPPHPRRERDRVDCEHYAECLDAAARFDRPWVCADDCRRYCRAVVVVPVPVRTNWQIESAGVSNRRNSEATAEDRARHVRSLEQRPLGAQTVMPWRLVG